MTRERARLIVFVTAAVAILVGAGLYVVSAVGERQTATTATSPDATKDIRMTESYVAFRTTAVDDDYGLVGVAALDDPAADPQRIDLSCERIHMSPSGGVCLAVDRRAVTTAEVLLLDGDMKVRHRLSTPGIPSRARVSPDGRWAATTTFVTGHSYAESGFSTRTEIYDVSTGQSLGNVEDFAITSSGEPVTAVDVNVWGVTFSADGDSFYATVKTGGQAVLARGSIAERAVAMLGVPAECPSLSPSGRHVAYKAASGPGTWQIRVRSVDGGREAVVAESRSVDDQIEWLDDSTVVYGMGRDGEAVTDVWAAPADGSGEPRLLVPAAWSPAVVRIAEPT